MDYAAVTKEFIKELKKCRSVSCYIVAGVARIRISKDESCDVGKNTVHEFQHSNWHQVNKASFVNVVAWASNWRALAYMLKPGDILFFRVVENNNDYLNAAEIPAGKIQYHPAYYKLHNDTLFVMIVRNYGTKRETEIATLELEHSICPDNSARAIIEYWDKEGYLKRGRQ